MLRLFYILATICIFGYSNKLAIIKIDGMTCPLCTVAIKRSLKHTKGVLKAKVRLNTQKATVTYSDDINESLLLDAIKKAGYKGKIISIEQIER